MEYYHAGQDEVDASAPPVSDAVDGACLARQVELEVQLVQVLEHLIRQIPDCALHHLSHSHG